MPTDASLDVTEVILWNNEGVVIKKPSIEQCRQGIALLEGAMNEMREASQQLLKTGEVESHRDDTDAGREPTDIPLEEPNELDLQNALKDIQSRVGLSEQEYAAQYNLKNIDIDTDFTEFEKRLRAAPVEKRVRIVEACERGENLVLFCKKDSGEFGLMNPRQIDRALLNREFNAWGARYNGRDPEKSQVSTLRARGMVHATKKDALHVTALDADNCEGVYWLTLAPKENMMPEELDNAQWAAGFNRRYGRSDVGGDDAHYRGPFQGGLGVLWV